MNDTWLRGELKEIRREECIALIESRSVGRIGYCAPRGAVILPVNHAVIGEEIVVRVESSGATARYLRDNGPGVGLTFEVDEFDDDARSGWSVMVTGAARSMQEEGPWTLTDRPVPWPAGGSWLYVRLHPDRVTGRRLEA